jgi:hypothetical protein
MDTLNYSDYIQQTNETPSNTTDYPVPTSAVLTQPGDKIVAYIKSQFAAQVPYYGMGIRSVNADLAKYNHTKEF